MLTPERPWDDGLWAALAEAGLTGVGLPEEAGGSGGELADAVAIVRTLAAGCRRGAGGRAAAGGRPGGRRRRPGPAAGRRAARPSRSARRVTAHASDDGDGPGRFTLSGTVTDVAVERRGPAPRRPGGRARPGRCWRWSTSSGIEATSAANLAGEPRGSLVLDDVAATGALLTSAQVEELKARYALARAVQLAAALEQVLAWTVQYAGERQQFGRPLGKFQAIQMELAEMAGEVTAVTALTDAAVQAVERGGERGARRARRPRCGRGRRSRSWPGWPTRCTARSGSRRSTSCTT